MSGSKAASRLRKERAAVSAGSSEKWTLSEWLSSITSPSTGTIADLVADALSSGLREGEQLTLMKELGQRGDRDSFLRLLTCSTIIDRLADLIFSGAQELASARAATADGLQSKFAQDVSAFELAYGSLDMFYGGLESLIGPPKPTLFSTMWCEHCSQSDSDAQYTTSNYSVTTTSRIEWAFVVDPEGGCAPPDCPTEKHATMVEDLQRAVSPEGDAERTNKEVRDPGEYENFKAFCASFHADFKSRERDSAFDSGLWPREERITRAEYCRIPMILMSFKEQLIRLNQILENLKQPAFLVEEFIGGRLYTGPMFVKYNGVLRAASGFEFMVKQFDDLCLGNKYVTTLHVVNSALIKLSKLMPAIKVYRGIKGGILPPQFWEPNHLNVRGGIEYGFMSTTAHRQVALSYAGSELADTTSTMLEIQLGMVDRGAELSWLSQYPHEAEVCFGPLTGLEVVGSYVCGTVLVAKMRLNVNLMASTVEQVVSKRKKVVANMIDHISTELRHVLGCGEFAAEERMLRESGCIDRPFQIMVNDMFAPISERKAEEFNDDENLKRAVASVVDVRTWLVGARAIKSGTDVLRLLGMRQTSTFTFREHSTDALHAKYGQECVLRAWYGAPGHDWTQSLGKDVTAMVKDMIQQGEKVVASNHFGDPAQNIAKWLLVQVAEPDIAAEPDMKTGMMFTGTCANCQVETHGENVYYFPFSVGVRETGRFHNFWRARPAQKKGTGHFVCEACCMSDEAIHAAAVKTMEAHQDSKDACISLLGRRLIHSNLSKDSKLRFIAEKILRLLLGCSRAEVLRHLCNEFGVSKVATALPMLAISESFRAGNQTFDAEQMIEGAAALKEAGFSPLEVHELLQLSAEDLVAAGLQMKGESNSGGRFRVGEVVIVKHGTEYQRMTVATASSHRATMMEYGRGGICFYQNNGRGSQNSVCAYALNW